MTLHRFPAQQRKTEDSVEPPPRYAELQAATGFSFLHAASHAEEMLATGAALGLSALGVADRNTVAGLVRAHQAAKQTGLRLLPGCRLIFADGTPDLLCYPTDRNAWGRLTRLLTIGKLRVAKGGCQLALDDLLAHAEGQVLILVPPDRLDAPGCAALARTRTALATPGLRHCGLWLAATRRHRGDDANRLRAVAALAGRLHVPMLATNDALYHVPQRRPLHDVLTCIRLGCRIEDAGLALQSNAERHLKSPAEIKRLFRDYPEAIAASMDILARCHFSLDDLRYEYPEEPIPPGSTPDAHLASLAWEGATWRYPQGIPPTVRETLEKELRIITQLAYARYFLTVHDIVHYARDHGILCQGRGSAANSTVCYCLGITAVDPMEINLLFDRFISSERREPPDIDVDFEHERREEVIQYIYARYGRDRAGIAATVIHYRPKSAMREVGKALGLAVDATAALAAQSWAAGNELWSDTHIRQAGLDPESPLIRHTIALARELVGFPRHLSQHVGGFVLTRDRLDAVVPIGNAAMADRTFVEWDKDDLDALGIMKVDILALGMLTCIRKAFSLIGKTDLADIPREDPTTYQMLSRGDSLGVFQVESRAQMNMLPRLAPKEFYDLVIEVAIVRPGPIQGDMVHPYLRRRHHLEQVSYPSPSPECGLADELEQVLGKTLGVPLFQEQAMRIAITAAGFTPEEANQLRRAMATFRHVGTIHNFAVKMVEGMVGRGYQRDFAEACFRQIEGFGTYGFPESHAASFALLVYISAWLKCHYPASFACALLNSQPMGFYAPAQIVRDAREHGVMVQAIDINASEWDCTMESASLRLGFRMIDGFREEWAAQAVATRGTGWQNLSTLLQTGLPKKALLMLAEANALRSIGLDRRTALWQIRGLQDYRDLSLFAKEPTQMGHAKLPPMPQAEQVVADYQATGLSLTAHPLRFLRHELARQGVRCCSELAEMSDGMKLRVAGVVTVRQRPGSAEGVVFATIEDETGIANIVIWPSLLERFRREVLGASLLLVHGQLQRSPEGVIHVVAKELEDRSFHLLELSDEPRLPLPGHGDEGSRQQIPAPSRTPSHPRNVRVIPPSRDFH
jgi:error-prone DNA polymerase